MSYEAVSWAMAQQVGKSSTKFVLVAMAHCVNAESGDMVCWPSAKRLAEITGQDVKTIETSVVRLREACWIVDTGARRGMTGQVIVYRLNTTKNGGVNEPEQLPQISAKTPKNGAVDAPHNSPVFPDNSPVFPVELPRFSGGTPPKTGDGIRKEQGKEQGRNKEKSACASMPGVPDQLFSDYMAVRKAKKAGPLTTTAVNGLIREAEKAGKTLAEAVTICCERGWQSLKAEWLIDRPAAGRTPQTHNKPNRHSGFDLLDYTTGVNQDGSFV